MSNNQHGTPTDDNTDEKSLSDQDLSKISGGANIDRSQSPQSEALPEFSGVNPNSLEPGPTFPAPPHSEELP